MGSLRQTLSKPRCIVRGQSSCSSQKKMCAIFVLHHTVQRVEERIIWKHAYTVSSATCNPRGSNSKYNHIKAIHQRKKFFCSLCDASHVHRSSLYRHKKKKHIERKPVHIVVSAKNPQVSSGVSLLVCCTCVL